MSDFMGEWFKGFEEGLLSLEEEQRNRMLCECGKACSRSYSLGVYQKIWNNSDSISDLFGKLGTEIKGVNTYEIQKDRIYEVEYTECLCDLYINEYVHTGALCECSRSSLLYDLESILPEKDITVEILETILRGDIKCLLRVTIL